MSFITTARDWRLLLRSTFLGMAVVLPVAFYLRTYDSITVKIALLELGVIAATALWLAGGIEEGRWELPERVLPLFAPATALLLWNVVRFHGTAHRSASAGGFWEQEALLVTFLLTLASFSARETRGAVAAILGGWLVAVLYGLAQRLGLDPFIWRGAFGGRVFSTAGNPKFFATYLLLCAPLSMALVLDEQTALWLRATAGAVAVLASVALVWTRAPLILAVFTLTMTLFAALACRALSGSRRWIALGLSALCLAAALGTAGPAAFRDDSRAAGKDFLVETWKGTAALIAAKPWLGHGPGSFWVEYPAFRRPRVIRLEHKHNTETDHAESEPLEQWADGGLPAALLWLCLFGAALYQGWRALTEADPQDAPLALGLLTAVAASALAMTVSTAARFPHPGWLIYFTAGLLGALRRPRRQPETVLAVPVIVGKHRRLLLAPILAAAAWLAWQSASRFQSDIHHNIAIYWSKEKGWDNALMEYDLEAPGTDTYVMSRYFKGNVFQDRGGPGDLERAVAQYRLVRSLAPHYVEVHYQEATALRKLGRSAEAIEQLETETRIDPTWDQPWRELSELYAAAGLSEKAARTARTADEAARRWEHPDE